MPLFLFYIFQKVFTLLQIYNILLLAKEVCNMIDLRVLNEFRYGDNGKDRSCEGDFLIAKDLNVFRISVSKEDGWSCVSFDVCYEADGEEMTRKPTKAEIDEVKMVFFDSDEPVVMFYNDEMESDNLVRLYSTSKIDLNIRIGVSCDRSLSILPGVDESSNLLVNREESFGWTCYVVRVMRSGKIIKRNPNCREMLLVKKSFCEDCVAFEFCNNDEDGVYSRLFVPDSSLLPQFPKSITGLGKNEEKEKTISFKPCSDGKKS